MRFSGKSWCLLQERYPEYRRHSRRPYCDLAYRAIGRWAQYLVQVTIDLNQVGFDYFLIKLPQKAFLSLVGRLHRLFAPIGKNDQRRVECASFRVASLLHCLCDHLQYVFFCSFIKSLEFNFFAFVCSCDFSVYATQIARGLLVDCDRWRRLLDRLFYSHSRRVCWPRL